MEQGRGYFHLLTVTFLSADRRARHIRLGKPIGISLCCKELQKRNSGSNPAVCELFLISLLDPGSQD